MENINSDKVDLYVETKSEMLSTPFWAIDDVRICNVKGKCNSPRSFDISYNIFFFAEIKISTLIAFDNKFLSTESEEISCQSVLHQKWRPAKNVQPSLPGTRRYE